MSSAYGMLAGVAALSVFALAQPASALTMKQCSEKYKTANDAGAVGSMNWNDFRKAECGEGATMALKKVKAEKKAKTEPSTAAAGPSMQECSANFKAAKDADTLGGMTWNEFRKAGCVAKTAAAKPAMKKETARVAPAETTTTVSQQECSTRYQSAKIRRHPRRHDVERVPLGRMPGHHGQAQRQHDADDGLPSSPRPSPGSTRARKPARHAC